MQRFSKKRQAIYDCLCGTTTHPTADWIYRQLHPSYPDLSLATVYRNLGQMKDAGMIRSVGTIDGYEHFDGNTKPHTHFICRKCRAIIDLPEINFPQEALHRAEETTGFEIDEADLCFSGLCAACRSSLS